jgi:membrane-associated phospholipid phosphatase
MKRLSLMILSILFTAAVLARVATGQTPSASPPSPVPSALVDRGEFFDPHPKRLLRRFGHEEYRIWSSPFRASSYDAHTIKKYVIPFAVIAGALIATDTRTADALPNTSDQVTWSGRVSQLGAAYTLAGASGATALLGHAFGNDHALETGLLALEALAHTQVVVFGIKQITNRSRPDRNDDVAGFWKGGDSFPSGHAASAFSVAAVFAYEYREHIAVPITAYTIAGAVSVSRLGARRHWLSDIFVGGSTGFLLGRYVYRKHHDPSLPGNPVQRSSAPEIRIGAGGVAAIWRW